MYGLVPPEAVAVNVTAAPTVPLVGPLTVTVRASGLIVTVADFVFDSAFPSVTVTEMVLLPLVE